MKSLIAAVCMLGTAVSIAETILGPTTNGNNLVVGTNQAIILTAFAGGYSSISLNSIRVPIKTPQIQASIDFDAHTPLYGRSSFPLPIVGPIELSIPTNSCISFSRIPRGPIETAIVSVEKHYTITVPPNRSVFFFKPSTFRVEAVFEQEKRSVIGRIYGGEQFDGPLSITLQLPTGTAISAHCLTSFFISDQSLATHDVVAGGALDVFPVIIERSFDLQSWTPVGTNTTKTAGGRAFFRLTMPHR